ncbi:hypothetical protein CJ030_MR3G022838 [Morella rubra]|uniref:Uncharacterized protein n=1 Tax=Morella rubra TaxID=262757 RepID=A0A6A1W3W7_9ROSI|nr:hypothetical protein CJ030_MR3G022838 [Morella rubra]
MDLIHALVRGIEMMSNDSIGAFYIDYAGRLYCVRNLGEESDYFLQTKKPCVNIHENSDDNRMWFGYFLVIAYEAHEHEKSNSRSFDGTRSDFDQFVEFVYHFETNEGLLKSPLVLHAPKDYSLGPIGFGVYIPAKWFLELLHNLEGWSYIKASVETRSLDVEVEECWVCLDYRNSSAELYLISNDDRNYGLDLVHYLATCYWGKVSPAACGTSPLLGIRNATGVHLG